MTFIPGPMNRGCQSLPLELDLSGAGGWDAYPHSAGFSTPHACLFPLPPETRAVAPPASHASSKAQVQSLPPSPAFLNQERYSVCVGVVATVKTLQAESHQGLLGCLSTHTGVCAR